MSESKSGLFVFYYQIRIILYPAPTRGCGSASHNSAARVEVVSDSYTKALEVANQFLCSKCIAEEPIFSTPTFSGYTRKVKVRIIHFEEKEYSPFTFVYNGDLSRQLSPQQIMNICGRILR